MANRWGKKWKQWLTLFFRAPRSLQVVTAAMKRRLLFGRNVMTNLDSILKTRDISLPKKVCLIKAMVFLVVMYGCESWTIKKTECRRIDPFELWYWRKLLRVPWTARSNQSILKEINPEYSLEGLMLKLKLQYWPPDVKNWLIWKDPDAGKDWMQEEKRTTEDEIDDCMANSMEFEQAPEASDGQESLPCCSPWGYKESDMIEQLNWTKRQKQCIWLYHLLWGGEKIINLIYPVS